VIGGLCRRPALLSASPTPAVLFRLIDAYQPTLLLDEFNRDADVADDITAVLCAGYERGATILRCVGDDHEPQPFRCYGPKLIATRRRYKDDALESRLLLLRMPGDKPDDVPAVVDRDALEREAADLRDALTAWRLANWPWLDLTDAGCGLPDLEPRAIQIMTPILALAEPAERDDLLAWFARHYLRRIEDESDRLTARAIRAALREDSEDSTDGDSLEPPSCQKIGYVARSLGLPRVKDADSRRMCITRDAATLRRLRRRYAPDTLPRDASEASKLRCDSHNLQEDNKLQAEASTTQSPEDASVAEDASVTPRIDNSLLEQELQRDDRSIEASASSSGDASDADAGKPKPAEVIVDGSTEDVGLVKQAENSPTLKDWERSKRQAEMLRRQAGD